MIRSFALLLAIAGALTSGVALGRETDTGASVNDFVIPKAPFAASGSFLALSSPEVECTMISGPPAAIVRTPLPQGARAREPVGFILSLHTYSCRPRTPSTAIQGTKNWGFLTTNGLIREVNNKEILASKVAWAFIQLALRGQVQTFAPPLSGGASGAYTTGMPLKAEDFKGCQVYRLPLPCGLWSSGTLTVPKTRRVTLQRRKRDCRAFIGGRTTLLLCEDAINCTLAQTVTLGFATLTRRCRPRPSRIALDLFQPKERPPFERVLRDPRCDEFAYLRSLAPSQLDRGLVIFADRQPLLPFGAPFILTLRRTATGCPKG